MKLKRTTTALGIAAAALVVGTVTPAGAAETAPQEIGVTANAPTVRPLTGYKVIFKNKYEETNCEIERICLSVWSPGRNQWAVFAFQVCDIYNVFNWEGDGYWQNNQTGGAVGKFYSGSNGTGTVTKTKPAPPRTEGRQNWGPINSVRPC